MKTKLIAGLIVMAVSSPVFADRSIGRPDCGQWVSRKESNFSTQVREHWLTGFMSGLNFGDEQGRDSLKKVSSADQIFLWMDNYCKANPLEDVSYGGETLMEELRKK